VHLTPFLNLKVPTGNAGVGKVARCAPYLAWLGLSDIPELTLEIYKHMSNKIRKRKKPNTTKAKKPSVNVAVIFDQAFAQHQAGNFDQAESLYKNVLAKQAKHFDALHCLGLIELHKNNQLAALSLIDQAIELCASNEAYFSNRGIVLRMLGRFDEALISYDHAISLNPENPIAYFNKGIVLNTLGRYEEALISYKRSLVLRPDYIEALVNLGNLQSDLNRHNEALASYAKVHEIKPNHAEAHWGESISNLKLGNFTSGFAKYEWRWQNKKLNPQSQNFTKPVWLGKESLIGKTIYLYAEQGLGDSIQFCRYAKFVSAQSATVVLGIQPPLKILLSNLQGIDRIVTSGDPLPNFDYHCPLMSLPLAFGTNMDSIPVDIPYLSSEPAKVAVWKLRLKETTKAQVGLVWSGSTGHANDHNRSIPLAKILKLITGEFQFFSLQKEVLQTDYEALQQANLQHFGDQLHDFTDTAALIELMDLVISVDTSVAHLAGAMGKPVWLLLPFNADWRWLLDRDDSPWYPTMRLFRQNAPGDWDGVLERVKNELTMYVF
jgi:hypothetical protein